MKKNYPHNVIRLRKGKRVKEQVLWIIAILNKKKMNSLDVKYKIGYIQFGEKRNFAINFKKLAFFINKGYIMNSSVKFLISLLAHK